MKILKFKGYKKHVLFKSKKLSIFKIIQTQLIKIKNILKTNVKLFLRFPKYEYSSKKNFLA